jgi:HAD superfamily hydrolase (TIGR01509 family)
MIKALIFDFDGVLVLSEGPRFIAVKSIAARHGIELDENTRRFAKGKTTLKVLESILPDNPELVHTLFNEYKKEYIDHIAEYIKPLTFTVNFIRNYDGTLPIAIASMSSKETIERLTKHFGIYEKITYIVGKNEVINHKPNPEIYLKAAADLGVPPEDCMVFEDTVIGVQAALSAKMACCVVLNGENSKEEFKDMKIHSYISTEKDFENILNS